ncbi:hypothetical protein G647_09773 [Cladophialophora carrionii CBS 160.54]|uniref:Uncharacterized protein n=1 Tax=Cladophialophora carrionii CBS 160.54 TaxID=1279043 RepID=V9DK76_9EURO|nr:uncharacterized protein G647_09773 [Cladophialophora carrionii CBS 160.54]ETI27091.1 hypothetical protein G647_09773 [Cladophialophora carrionii CBS 160.54]
MFMLHWALASPVPEIFSPEADTLSFTELAQKAFLRILELGFIRGILVSLLILCALVCLLIGTLRVLAAYLHHHDTKLWETYEEVHACADGEKEVQDEADCRRASVIDECQPYNLQCQKQSRNSRYIMANPSTPITKINVHAFPRRAAVVMSPYSPSETRFLNPIRSTSTPLRSALTKSPPSSKRLPSARSYLFGPRSTSTSTCLTPSPKSVRWADQIHVSITSTLEMSVRRRLEEELQAGTEPEIDLATRTIASRNRLRSDVLDILSHPIHHAEPLPAHDASSATPAIAIGDGPSDSRGESCMQLEGDTS